MAETRTKKACHPHTFRHVYSNTKFEDAPVAVVCCAVGLLWTNAAKVILNKSCQYSGVGLQISLSGKAGPTTHGGATHRENGMGRRMSEITKVAPWPRLPEGTVADHPHQCRAWTGPGMRCRCRVCIRTPSVCAELSCTHIRAPRVQGRSRQRRPAGRAGAKRLLAAVHGSARMCAWRDPGVSQKPQLSFGDGLHGCSAASKTTRPGP